MSIYCGRCGPQQGKSGSKDPRGEIADAPGDVLECLLKRLGRTVAHRIGHGPMDSPEPAQLFVGTVTNSHHEVPFARHLIQAARRDVWKAESVALGYLDGTSRDPVSRMRSGRHRRYFADLLPERRGQLRPRTVSRAHEQHAARSVFSPGHQAFKTARREGDVAASLIRLGTVPRHQAGFFERTQMMGEQVRRHVQLGLQFLWREVTQSQQVDDAQACGVSESGMLGNPLPEYINSLNVHWLKFD
jgi:hypothetical protein